MRVLLAASKYLPEYTGAAYRLHRLYRELCKKTPEWSVKVLCGGIEYADRDDRVIDGIPVHHIRSRAAAAGGRVSHLVARMGDAWETLRYLRGERCDVIHTVGTSAVVAAAIHHARRRDIPLLVELVTSGAEPDQSLPVLGHFRKPELHHRCAIVAISEALRDSCAARGYERNVWFRPNPVDAQRFVAERAGREQVRSEVTPFGPEDVVVAAIAKFMPQKNQAFLLDAMALLDDRFKLVLAGPLVDSGSLARRDRNYFEALLQRIVDLRLQTRVHIVPEFVPAERYIKAADVFAMPSLMEGMGTPILEAQACGVPVVANAAIPAFNEHIDEGRTGFLRPLDAPSWAQAIRTAAMLPPASLQAVAEAIAHRYSTESTNRRYRRLIEALVQPGSSNELDVAALFGQEA